MAIMTAMIITSTAFTSTSVAYAEETATTGTTNLNGGGGNIPIIGGNSTINENSAGATIETNTQTIITNNGTVTTNNGSYTNEFGHTYTLGVKGTININNGIVETNNGDIGTNSSKGTINTNNGSITVKNEGTVVTNNASKDSSDGYAFKDNYGTVTNNNGYILTNRKDATVTNNNELIIDNYGTVETNYDTIVSNLGTVNNNAGTITANYGGTIKSGNEAVNTYYKVDVTAENASVEYTTGFTQKDENKYLQKDKQDLNSTFSGTITLTANEGYEIQGSDSRGTAEKFTYTVQQAQNGSYQIVISSITGNVTLTPGQFNLIISQIVNNTPAVIPETIDATGTDDNNAETEIQVSAEPTQGSSASVETKQEIVSNTVDDKSVTVTLENVAVQEDTIVIPDEVKEVINLKNDSVVVSVTPQNINNLDITALANNSTPSQAIYLQFGNYTDVNDTLIENLSNAISNNSKSDKVALEFSYEGKFYVLSFAMPAKGSDLYNKLMEALKKENGRTAGFKRFIQILREQGIDVNDTVLGL